MGLLVLVFSINTLQGFFEKLIQVNVFSNFLRSLLQNIFLLCTIKEFMMTLNTSHFYLTACQINLYVKTFLMPLIP